MDSALIAREFLVALRGKRSQVAWSRRLGYRSNVAYTWESGRRQPTVSEAWRAAQRAGIDVRQALRTFYGHETRQWLDEVDDVTSVEATAAFLRDLKGRSTTAELARRAGLSRYGLTRWLAGQTQPRLPDFFTCVEAASLRLVDLVCAFVPPGAVPSVAPLWERLQARREGASRHPWTQAVLRALEVADYRALPMHEPGWIARRIGISDDEERACLDYLRATGQVEAEAGRGGLLRPATAAVDTRGGAGAQLKSHWARVGVQRIEAGAPGQFSYNVFTCSEADFERIRELHLGYYRALRQIVAESTPEERVVVANIQLFMLDPPESEG